MNPGLTLKTRDDNDKPSLVDGLEHGFYDFLYIGNNHPN